LRYHIPVDGRYTVRSALPSWSKSVFRIASDTATVTVAVAEAVEPHALLTSIQTFIGNVSAGVV
jgi:hypothetical protein